MMERRQIVKQWSLGDNAALVTLIRAEGSSYRRPGAHLLIANGGAYAGAVSGGCLEAEIVRKAAWMVRGGAIVERYSTLFDDTAEIPFGLGCGGVVDLLIEPSDTPECHALISAMEASLSGTSSVVATRLPAANRPLQRAIWNASGEIVFSSAGLQAHDLDSLKTTSFSAEHNLNPDIYVERLIPPLHLFVLGAGSDARPVVSIASLLGWRVTVVDVRSQSASPQAPARFPEADCVMPAGSLSTHSLSSADAVVLMTHSYEQDRSILAALLREPAISGYIGLLGAAHRSSLLVSEVAATLGCTVAECCERIWAPVGLDLGGDGAEAIALAVVAEVHAWSQGKLAASRRLTAGRVAQHVASGGASRYLQTQCATK